ncbi:MAG TPA: type II secretion system protein [Armatimonadota bacterium]|jgi:prepilin-type N-terminal cleavage/methylation domain-containing protein/prepilin-type processing-associated H-X9-DG protein
MNQARRLRTGFTLVEMLVVIAIIAVLSAILFPVIANARNNARRVECISHLKNLGMAFSLYCNDSYQYFPTWCVSHPNPMAPPTPKDQPAAGIITWDITIGDYVEKKVSGIMTCPTNPMPEAVIGTPGAKADTLRAYAIARYTQRSRRVGVTTIFTGGNKAMIPDPAATVLLFEKGANLPGSWGDALGENVYQSHSTKGQPGYSEIMFHVGGKNFLFVDGNAKWYHDGQGPFALNPAGSNGVGACERWGTAAQGGDWPE